ncbi:MAG: alpha/beta fold hydrolase [Actinomycetota bacterium]|nr:alpha/beta fold hydrolase [Actinomycetota bacterium]
MSDAALLEVGPEDGRAVVVLAHGAGAGMRSEFMAFQAEALAAAGLVCLRFEFPYMQAGRKSPDKAAVLEDAWRRVAEAARERAGDRPLVLGGKSMGGRIASQAVAEGAPADGLVFHGYPLHPPGRPDRIRKAHLPDVPVPMLFVEGTRDPFCPLDTLRDVIAETGLDAQLAVIDDGDHSFKVRAASGRSTRDAWGEAAARTVEWIDGTLPPGSGPPRPPTG